MEIVRASADTNTRSPEGTTSGRMTIVRDNEIPTESAEVSVTKKDNFLKRGLGKVRGMAGNVAHKAGGALGSARDLSTHLPRPNLSRPNIHRPNVDVGGIKDAAVRATYGISERARNAPGVQGVGNVLGEGVKLPGHAIGKGVELSRAGAEALINGIGHVLENKKAFGKSVANFALGNAASRGISTGSKELAKAIVSYSGLAGAVGGGVTGTVAAGAFVGAMSGALVEYARQVNSNLDEKVNKKVKEETEADPNLAGRKAAFLLKFKQLRNAETLKPTDLKKIRNAAIFGAIAGAGAGALVEYIPEISEFVKNIPGVQGFRDISVVQGLRAVDRAALETAGNLVAGARDISIVQGAGDIAGRVGEVTDQYVPGLKGTKELVGRTFGLEDTSKAGQVAAQGADQAAQGIGDTGQVAEQAAQGADQAAQEAAAPPKGFVSQADFDNLKEKVAVQDQQIEDLKRQMGEINKTVAVARGATPGAGDVLVGATDSAQAAAEQAAVQSAAELEKMGASIPLNAGSNPWEVSINILKQIGVANPTPEQIMQLDKVVCQENNVSVPAWGIKGAIDSRNLPVGFNLNLTDTVKKTALEIASKK